MGGRGTFALGNNVEYVYSTTGYICGVKILDGGKAHKILPEESHSSEMYIQLHLDGTFKALRIYNKEHYLVKEIGYHHESRIDKTKKYVLHVHDCTANEQTFEHPKPHPITKEEYQKYKKYFIGVDDCD